LRASATRADLAGKFSQLHGFGRFGLKNWLKTGKEAALPRLRCGGTPPVLKMPGE
jgi:hypothetical protein